MSTTNILDLNNRIDELEKNSGGGGSADSAKRSDIATEFSTETSYTAGNFVYHDGKLYQFNADHAAGAWDPTDVVEANVTDQIVSNKAAIEGLTASDIMMSDGVTSVEDVVTKVINPSGISITPKTGVTITSQLITTQGALMIAQIKATLSSPSTSETEILQFSGFSIGNYYINGIITDSSCKQLGVYIFSSSRLYIHLTSAISSSTVICLNVMGFNAL